MEEAAHFLLEVHSASVVEIEHESESQEYDYDSEADITEGNMVADGLPSPTEEAALAELDTIALAHELASVSGTTVPVQSAWCWMSKMRNRHFVHCGIDGRHNRLHGYKNLHSSSTRGSSRPSKRIGKVA
jgi:hypothetical protein